MSEQQAAGCQCPARPGEDCPMTGEECRQHISHTARAGGGTSDEPKQGVWVLIWPNSKTSRTCVKLFATEKRARSEAQILESLGIEYVIDAAEVTP